MAQDIRLHGGPMQGMRCSVQDGRDHFHIVEPNPAYEYGVNDATVLPTREGMYSRAYNSKTDFEWDGWRSHD